LLAGVKNTMMLAASGLSRIAVAVLVSSVGIGIAQVSGPVIGIVGWMAGFALEATLLAMHLKSLDRRRGKR
jgi:hypothetical protein